MLRTFLKIGILQENHIQDYVNQLFKVRQDHSQIHSNMRLMNDKMQQKNNEVRVKDFSESSIKTPTETDSDRQDKKTLSRNK